MSKNKAPKHELIGQRWSIEYQENNQNLTVNPDERQTVSVFKCSNSVVNVTSKCTSVLINNCNQVGVVIDSVVASLEAVNCQKLQLQVNGVAPTLQLDNVQSVSIYIKKEHRESFEFITAGVTGVNIVVLDGDNDPQEVPVPQQFISKFVGNNLDTKPTDHTGV